LGLESVAVAVVFSKYNTIILEKSNVVNNFIRVFYIFLGGLCMNTAVSKILHLMEVENVSGTKLTSALGISSSSVTEWKKGKASPSVDAIVKISKFFKVTTDYLLYDEIDMPLRTPTRFVNEEISLVNKSRYMMDDGYSWDDIFFALSLPKDVLQIAARWMELDKDGAYVVGGTLIQEERRITSESKKTTQEFYTG
jgi:transcriptional regulator with XRE-family HTH domain